MTVFPNEVSTDNSKIRLVLKISGYFKNFVTPTNTLT